MFRPELLAIVKESLLHTEYDSPYQLQLSRVIKFFVLKIPRIEIVVKYILKLCCVKTSTFRSFFVHEERSCSQRRRSAAAPLLRFEIESRRGN
jgi:hypothetical protein